MKTENIFKKKVLIIFLILSWSNTLFAEYYLVAECTKNQNILSKRLHIKAKIVVDKKLTYANCRMEKNKLLDHLSRISWKCKGSNSSGEFCLKNKPSNSEKYMSYTIDENPIIVNFLNFENLPMCGGFKNLLKKTQNIDATCFGYN